MLFICAAITRPSLDKIYLERIDRARARPKRSFHSLVTLRCLAVWGLGPELTEENLAHEETSHRSKCSPSSFTLFFLLSFFITRLATMKEKKGKKVASGIGEEEDVQVQDKPTPLTI